MQCPKCLNQPLRATKLEQGLSAMGCSQCEGAFVTLLYYRDWVERNPSIDSEEKIPLNTAELQEVDDSHSALSCPKCSRLMSKYKISGESNNRIDLCFTCDEAWLDGGEWELLKALELSKKMPLVFTEQWQKKLQKQATQQAREQRLLKFISQQDLDEVKRIRQWLAEHPNKEQLMFFVNQ